MNPANLNEPPEHLREVRLHRRLLLVAAGVYMAWWFGIHLLLPNAFNPIVSRLVVVALILGCWALSYVSSFVSARLRLASLASAWLVTGHFYYLFYVNGGDANWMVGSYITVIAISLFLFTTATVMSYSVFVIFLSGLMVYWLPHLRDSIFLPGLITILAQANIGLRARLGAIKNLIASNERFQLLFNSTFDGILVHENGRIITSNDSLTEISGFRAEELVGKNVLDILTPEQRALVKDKIGQLEVAPYETHGLRKDGRVIDVEVRAKGFIYDGRPAKLVAVQDISDRKKAERERIKALSAIENLRLRDEFISIASHELKTPISSLKLQTQIIQKDLGQGISDLDTPEKVEEVMALFERQIDRLTELVEAMLDVSKITAGRFVLEKSAVDFSALVRDTVTLLSVHASAAGFPPIETDIPPDVRINGDRRRLQQVIENVLGNALKYGDRKPVKISVKVESDQVELRVLDHGIGIGAEYLPRIFDRFERAISSRNISGLGLGLYITKQIVEAHGGRIDVDSRLGQGAVFTVRLPR